MDWWWLGMVRVYRQGDVVLIEREHEVELEEKVADKLVIQSETGHAHVLEAPVYRGVNGRLYAVVNVTLTLKHPEHPPLEIKPGVYEVRRVRDYALSRPID
jgi:hypothetical protein